MDRLDKKSDDTLVTYIKEGDRAAFNIVFERYWEDLCHAAYKLLKDESSAKDVVQEVFFDFWSRREQHDIMSLSGFLYQAVRYQSLKQLRKLPSLDIYELRFQDILQENTTEEAIYLKQLGDRLEQQLGELPQKYRTVFEMSRVQNLSNKEIATKLQLSQRTVEWYLHTILKHLKTSLTGMVLFFWF
ncbi:RNA polymerase sigma-70 factor [Reichenbachiella sp. MSK19-1]|uniref:RNA polymerase sigma-70 factor n=1 Tax=Reichenbachiella sp. MSK19-1 TaxID=1897631 RepID=UPI000EE30156|nr:RNA polymerase sigma-70 factor [Reichenbachiella sp. MSK19-1]RJE72012.1 hypothetical protein BGP76_08005 [Reichenbachiella sp. MSK19-1]